jgi:hypothetical protein
MLQQNLDFSPQNSASQMFGLLPKKRANSRFFEFAKLQIAHLLELQNLPILCVPGPPPQVLYGRDTPSESIARSANLMLSGVE